MIELAVALDLAEHGYGTFGENIFVNQSPVLDTGSIASKDGIWLTSTTMSSGHGTYTDQITISTRYFDVITQEETLLKLMHYINTQLVDACSLSCEPESPIVYNRLTITPASSIDLDAVDNEGHFVKSIRFTITYPLPDISRLK